MESYKAARYAGYAVKSIYEDLVHSGKKELGEFYLKDGNYITWKIKVRVTGNRGRYLKLKSNLSDDTIRVSADGYKPSKYLQMRLEEWMAFAAYVKTRDSRLKSCLEDVLDRLVADVR
ncbi:hypothetical protein GEI7407_1392 [Geitlerinema sp. PCC 7407]|nr:hypothetical protein GEI7407_1392 [Geitlerinema sp. PCC 7407]